MVQKPTWLRVRAKPFPNRDAGSLVASHGRKGQGWCPHAWKLMPTCPPHPARWVLWEPQWAGTQLSRFHQLQVFSPHLGGGERQKGSGEVKLEKLHYKPTVIPPSSSVSATLWSQLQWGLFARKTLCIHTENFHIATCWCAGDTEEDHGTHCSWAGSM